MTEAAVSQALAEAATNPHKTIDQLLRIIARQQAAEKADRRSPQTTEE